MSEPGLVRTWTDSRLLVVIGVLVVSFGCRGEVPLEREPLIDGLHSPLVLTEGEIIELPSSLAPNRFVRGWWPFERRNRQGVGAGPGARLQGVSLGNRRRRLIVRGMVLPKTGGEVEVSFAGRPWRTHPLRSNLRIPVPTDLPPGRFSVDFRLSDEAGLAVWEASFSRALAAGQVKLDGEDIIQSPTSLIELVRPVGRRGALLGRFVPPGRPADGQRFALLASVDGLAEEEVFAWDSSMPGGEHELRIPLDQSGRGLARVRLLATGQGGPARWMGLTLESEVKKSAAVPAHSQLQDVPSVVILYIMDALRRDHVGHLGGPEGITPTLDRLASEGATFRNHFSVAPNTVPSMKTLLAGRVFLNLGGSGLPADLSTTVAEAFKAEGYATGLFSGNGNVSPWRGMDRGYEHVSNRVLYGGKKSRAVSGYNDNAERVHEAILEWMGWLAGLDKLFVHAQTIHPHNPYNPPEPFLSRFAPANGSTVDGRTETLIGIRAQRLRVDEEDQERLRGLYAGGVAYNDAKLGEFLDAVLERFPPEEVLLIVTSDHGEELFDHDGVLHGYTLFEEQLQIPLIVWSPGTVPPREIDAMTDNLDLYATLIGLLPPDEASEAGGKSLWPLMLSRHDDDEIWDKDVVFSAAASVPGGIYAAQSDRYKVIYAPRRGPHWGMGQGLGRGSDPEYFFDLGTDPGETTNLIGDDLPAADWLWSRLMVWIEAGRRLESGVPLEEMDEDTKASLRALGYIQ